VFLYTETFINSKVANEPLYVNKKVKKSGPSAGDGTLDWCPKDELQVTLQN
jgi:hypothetical protein